MTPPPSSTRRGVAVAGALVVLVVAFPLVLGDPLATVLIERFVTPVYPAPPTLAVASPHDGDGVSTALRIVGEATAGSRDTRIVDVQVRVDGQGWRSVAAPRGVAVSAFAADLTLTQGDHIVEVRASDGAAFSPTTRLALRAGSITPATVRILQPLDGEGLAEGRVDVRGTVEGGAAPYRILVREGTQVAEAVILASDARGALWGATLDLASGVRTITASAEGPDGSLPRSVMVSVGPTIPPTLTILTPRPGAAYGTAGSDACPDRCVLFTGAVSGPSSVAVVRASVDDGEWAEIAPTGGAFAWPLDISRFFTGEHRVVFVAQAPDGATSAPRDVSFLLRSPRTLRIHGDDAPRPTGTPLTFSVDTTSESPVQWLVDGAPSGVGRNVTLTLARPGDHVLTAEVKDDGARATARLPLYAIDRPPTVTANATSATALQPALFTADASDPDGLVTAYVWTFGDGVTETTSEPVASHVYGRTGTYTASVVAVDDHGASSAPATMQVVIGSAPPVATFTYLPEHPTSLDNITFFDQSRDPDGGIASWAWDFGDGGSSKSRDPVHRFTGRGAHDVRLTVTDRDGSVASVTRIVQVHNIPPLAAFTFAPASPLTHEDVSFNDASVKRDGAIVAWAWDFGDGSTSSEASPSHPYARPGRYLVSLVVLDDVGATALKSASIVVGDAAPMIGPIVADPSSPMSGDPVRFIANVTDREEQLDHLEWDFGDGTTSRQTSPSHRYARAGDYDVTVTAVDRAGQLSLRTLRLHVADAPPTVEVIGVDGGFASFPTTIRVIGSDIDGDIVEYRFDMDGDGAPECVTQKPRCAHAYPAAGMYVARIIVVDDANLTGAAQRILEILPSPTGLAAPSLTIDSPALNATLKGHYEISGRAWGDSDIRLVEVHVRDADWMYGAPAWIAARGTGEWRVLLDTTRYADGPVDVVARATDARGTISQARLPVVLENGDPAPIVALRILTLENDDELVPGHVVRGTAHHPLGITSIRWRLDDGAWRALDGPTLTWSLPIAARDLKAGAHVLDIEAYHGPSERAAERIVFRVPEVRPMLLVDIAPGPVVHGVLHAEGRTSAGARVQWRIDDDIWREAKGASEWVIHAPPGVTGYHVVSLRAIFEESGIDGDVLTFPVRIIHQSPADGMARDPPQSRATPAPPVMGALAALSLAAVLFRRAPPLL